MELLEQIALAALRRDSLFLRNLVQDWVCQGASVSQLSRPVSTDIKTLVVSAALTELLAFQHGQLPPTWTQEIGALPEPFFLVEAAGNMKRLRILCEAQSPEPMRKRRLYAPPHFLQFA